MTAGAVHAFDRLGYFPANYFAARESFNALAKTHSTRTDRHPLEARGPDSETLTIDTAYFGASAPRRLLVISSGIHGVEGFAGSALQQCFMGELKGAPPLPDDCGILFIHAINPYGFAHLRRTNENNVDLNRNCLMNFPGPANPAYASLDVLLNPRSPPRKDLFIPTLAWLALRRGLGALIQPIAGGQYEFPKGLFYGGAKHEQSIAIVDHILRQPLYAAAAVVLHIDLHTGLGKYGTYTLLAQAPEQSQQFRRLQEWFGADAVVTNLSQTSGAYAASGLIGSVTKTAVESTQVYAATLEFGTYSLARVLASLRRENSLQHYGSIDSPMGRTIKAQFLENFCPRDEAWRLAVLEQGLRVFRQAMAGLFDPSS